MQLDELCALLKPVYGEQIDRLRYAWLAGKPEDKRLVEVRLNRLFDAMSQGKEQILLEPPKLKDAFGKYVLGEVLYGSKPRHSFGLREDEWIQHMAIFGRSGSGKTNLVMGVLWNFVRHQKPFLIFDWKRNYRDFLTVIGSENIQLRTVGREVRPFQFNPWLAPPGIERDVWIKKIVEVLNHAYFAGEGVMDVLMRGLQKAYEQTETPQTSDVLHQVEAVPETSRAAQWKQSALRILRALDFGPMGAVTKTASNAHLPGLLEQQLILELDALADSDKTALIEALLLWIHGYRLSANSREKFRHAIIIEEAHHILLKKKQETKGEAITDVILREIRELGEALIIVDQHPSLISLPAIGNSYTQISFNLKDQYDTQRAAQSMLLDKHQQDYLGLLPVGEAIVKLQGRHLRPFHIRVPRISIPKGSVTDQQLQEGVRRTFDLQLEGLDFEWCRVPDTDHWIKVPSLVLPARHAEHPAQVPGTSGTTAENAAEQLEHPREETAAESEHPSERSGTPETSPIGQPEQPVPHSGTSGTPSQNDGTCSAPYAKNIEDTGSNEVVPASDITGELGARGRRMLESLKSHPLLSVLERYEMLSLSRQQGDRAKNELLAAGLIRQLYITTKNGRRSLLEPTVQGLEILQMPKLNQPSIEHQYWVHHIWKQLRSEKYYVKLENYAYGYAPDLCFYGDERRMIIIEIETGKSDFVSNYNKALERKADRVYMLATDESALRRLEQKLPKASDLVVMLARDFQAP